MDEDGAKLSHWSSLRALRTVQLQVRQIAMTKRTCSHMARVEFLSDSFITSSDRSDNHETVIASNRYALTKKMCWNNNHAFMNTG